MFLEGMELISSMYEELWNRLGYIGRYLDYPATMLYLPSR